MNIHREITFEDEICAHLSAHGWLYDEGAATDFDRKRALYPPDLLAWVMETQPKSWEGLSKTYGASAETMLLGRVRSQLDQRGTLDVIRHGVEMAGVRGQLPLAQFKPALAMNEELVTRYEANRLRVIRQVRYSEANENSIDLVLLLNGIPVATAELKTDFTQSVGDAIDQYRFDRLPRSKGGGGEPLLGFKSGALVHFAVSTSEVFMTTQLRGPDTTFLPFNKGCDDGKGNPLNSAGYSTSYLWEEVWERDSWLQLLGRYIIAERDKKKEIKKLIFPRYHQLDATRKLVAAVRTDGSGQKYLIQHSAGSGKTNSIAWTAHFLADLHDDTDSKVFDTVLVVSDRRVIDGQLQEAIFNFERTTGVVTTIKGEGGSKSSELAEALAGGKKIVVCTIQTFPFALQQVRELAATEGKRFAVIADEAHSSQTGEAAAKLKQVLSQEEIDALNDGGEVSTEDVLAAQMAARASDAGITFVAFTATPKTKTLELFGRRPRPDEPAGDGNRPTPFHVYSMRQAIEEGFILDVLRNYTPYSLAFKLANEGRELDDVEIERSAAVKGIMQWVRLHPYNISQKVKIVVEHFRENVAPLLDGKAKAMVVVGSRREAVRWQLAIDRYIREQGYGFRTLVAFSGEVTDHDTTPESVTEGSPLLNPDLRGRDIREAFNDSHNRILLVANKFQTGFDQPLLCAMYVDKRLAGIQAVQTLSRLNRAYPGKDTTYVIDFVNSSDEVLQAFKTYYETAELQAETDPNLIYDLRQKLDARGYYDEFEVNRVVEAELKPGGMQAELIAAVMPVAARLLRSFESARERFQRAEELGDPKAAQEAKDEQEALILFRGDMGTYLRLYVFLSQIIDYGNSDLEKRAIFFRRLIPLLEFGREREGVDTTKLELTHYKLKSQQHVQMALQAGETEKLAPVQEVGSGSVQEKEKARLSEIIERVNELFEGELTEKDLLVYVDGALKEKLKENETLRQQAENNTKEQFASSPDLNSALMEAIIDALTVHTSMSEQALASEKIRAGLKEVLLGPGQLWEELQRSG